jgi:asparagine synthase (glutamine-hydrolysing)
MSAIFGIWNINGEPVERNQLQIMADKVRQYGRERQKIQVEKNIGFGCCLSQAGRYSEAETPFYSENGVFLVSDALLYNRAELCQECHVEEMTTLSTQALLLTAYQKWGVECPRHINGDFTFAIWEPQKQQVTLVRDHLGVRPLYYFYNSATLAFATDYRALVALPFVSFSLNEIKLYILLAKCYRINPEETCFADIRKLPPAHILQLDGEGLRKRKYWTPGENGKIHFNTEAGYIRALSDLVDDAIRRRVHSAQSRLGAEMSGGLDSSVIAVLANRELTKVHPGQSLPLYSWSPDFKTLKEQDDDERILIETVCSRENMHCSYYNPTKRHNFAADTPLLAPVEFPDNLPLLQGMELLSEQGVRWVFSGWGGDEGISHRTNLFELFLQGDWGHFIAECLHSSQGSPLRFVKRLIANAVLPFFRPFCFFANFKIYKPIFFAPDFAKKMRRYSRIKIFHYYLNLVKCLESGVIQTRTELTAWRGADYNVQYLFPYLDYRVVDFAVSIPRRLFYKQGINRYVYRKAFEGILPRELCYHMVKDEKALDTFHAQNKERNEALNSAPFLQRELFAAYIDWDQVDAMNNDPSFVNDPSKYHSVQRVQQICYNIQRLIADAKK